MTRKILIVDDDPLQRRMTALLIQKKIGLKTIDADGGSMALSILSDDIHRREIGLALVDFKMPEMDGIELLKIIKHKYPDIPVIILSGSKDADVATNAIKLGSSDFLNKPVNPQQLQASIHNALKTE